MAQTIGLRQTAMISAGQIAMVYRLRWDIETFLPGGRDTSRFTT